MPYPLTREYFRSGRRPETRLYCVFFLFLWLFLPAIALADTASAEPPLRQQDLLIELGDGGSVDFQVELAADAKTRQQGLMYRRHLPGNAGMLFDYHEPVAVQMWMKNTWIALDMLFIDADGQIVRIVENAQPRSLEIIDSTQAVRAVLEVNGGTVARHNIRVGDQVRHAIFDSSAE